MCPQLVDFNADGHSDLVMGTFEGVAFLVPGSKSGFQEPQRILDVDGNTILLSAFWNNKSEKWDNADRSPKGEHYPEDHCISVVALDWENRGVFDLLLGAKEGGIYLRRNEGTPGKPKFVTYNQRVMLSNKQPLMVPGGLTAIRVVDWNRDGKFDLVCGSFGGGVYLYLNTGTVGHPAFGDPQILVPPAHENASAVTAREPTRPTEGCYVDVIDYDGDGKLDLLVGGYSQWMPKQRELSDSEKKECEALERQIRTLGDTQQKIYQEVYDKAKGDKVELQKLQTELFKSEIFKKNSRELQSSSKRMDELRPQPRREAFVWLYRQK